MPSSRLWLLAAVVLLFAFAWDIARSILKSPYPGFEADLAKCSLNRVRPEIDYELPARRLHDRNRNGKGPTILKQVSLIDGDGTVSRDTTIVIEGDIFAAVCYKDDTSCQRYESSGTIHHLGGRFVTPGLIDMHSHVGVRAIPELWGSEDVTEVNLGPMSPWARAIDGLKPRDKGVPLVRSGGVTTALVLTGAKNLISGEGVVIKLKDSYDVHEMALDTTSYGQSKKEQRYLKMACGENTKLIYKDGGGPNTRQGESFLVRKAFEDAQSLKDRQDDWCHQASSRRSRLAMSSRYPQDLSLQTLVDVLRGDVMVHTHCYEPQDVTSLYDHADEFGFNVTALHHALEAHHVLDQLVSHNTMLATFSDEWGFKKEVFEASAYMLKAAADRGIPIAMTTDHPAKSGQLLAYEAQIANHFGLGSELALASMLSVPAKALGVDNRVGWVRPGFDSDLVVWDKHPLRLGSRPLQVFVEGSSAVNASDALWGQSHDTDKQAPAVRVQKPASRKSCQKGQKDIVIRGLKQSLLHGHKMQSTDSKNLTLVVDNGKISCLGDYCEREAQALQQKKHSPIIELDEGYLLPGLTLVTRSYGLAEILNEPSTSDGISTGTAFDAPIFSSNGLAFGGQHLDRAHRAGLTQLITPPRSSGFLHGVSALFRPGASHGLESGAIVQSEVGLHFTVGHEAKSSTLATISAQVSKLHSLLSPPDESYSHDIFRRAAAGDLPVIVHTGNKDTISQIIKLKQTLPTVRFIIMGGSEAHLVAASLAETGIPVIIAPWVCHPWSWDIHNCLTGPPLTDNYLASTLIDAGVDVALGNWDIRDRYVRNALWEASWVAGPKKPQLAVNLVSKNVRDILGLPSSDDFVIYERSPFEFGASVAVAFEDGEISLCWPDVE